MGKIIENVEFFHTENYIDYNMHPVSVAARILSRKVAGIHFSPFAFDRQGEWLQHCFSVGIELGSFLVFCSVLHSPELEALQRMWNSGALPKTNLILVDEPRKRASAMKILNIAWDFRSSAILSKDPKKSIQLEVTAIQLESDAEWILRGIKPIDSIIEQVIGRELRKESIELGSSPLRVPHE